MYCSSVMSKLKSQQAEHQHLTGSSASPVSVSVCCSQLDFLFTKMHPSPSGWCEQTGTGAKSPIGLFACSLDNSAPAEECCLWHFEVSRWKSFCYALILCLMPFKIRKRQNTTLMPIGVDLLEMLLLESWSGPPALSRMQSKHLNRCIVCICVVCVEGETKHTHVSRLCKLEQQQMICDIKYENEIIKDYL